MDNSLLTDEVSVHDVGQEDNMPRTEYYLSVPTDNGELYFVAVAGSFEPFVPARTNCSNDLASPAEGGFVEDINIYRTAPCGKITNKTPLDEDEIEQYGFDLADIESRLYELACEASEPDCNEDRD